MSSSMKVNFLFKSGFSNTRQSDPQAVIISPFLNPVPPFDQSTPLHSLSIPSNSSNTDPIEASLAASPSCSESIRPRSIDKYTALSSPQQPVRLSFEGGNHNSPSNPNSTSNNSLTSTHDHDDGDDHQLEPEEVEGYRMVTRAKDGIHKPKRFTDFKLYTATKQESTKEPNSVHEALL
ncbi:uncharacterized protein LOC125370221 [Ricinus communis]|uniref:uncharacterized protein LOC125370221 n=1 Tax=Ricinus communis TaxID=3988 RepID=UPI00201B0396|nr:uncharacterized protein LOC125370221 [Ricinus communis]